MDGRGWAASLSSELIDWRKGEDTERPSIHLRMDIKLWRKIVEGWLASEWAANPERDHLKKEIDIERLNSLLTSTKKHEQAKENNNED